jgi:hypothetical protein
VRSCAAPFTCRTVTNLSDCGPVIKSHTAVQSDHVRVLDAPRHLAGSAAATALVKVDKPVRRVARDGTGRVRSGLASDVERVGIEDEIRASLAVSDEAPQ